MYKKCEVCKKSYRTKTDGTMCTECLKKMIYNQYYGVEENPVPEEPETVIEPEPDYDLSDIRDTFKASNNKNIYEDVRIADSLGLSYGEFMAKYRRR